MNKSLSDYKWVFMGAPQIACDFLSELKNVYDITPDLIVTNPDRPVGRKKTMTHSPVKDFAITHDLPFLQTDNLDDISNELEGFDFFCVFAFSQLLKQRHLDLVRHSVVNLHPSILPQYRGPSPITTAIIDNQLDTGISLIQLDSGMDSGPIIAQYPVNFDSWSKYDVHENIMSKYGAELFANKMESYLKDDIAPESQDHEQATYCRKYTKADMEIDLSLDQDEQYRRYCAFAKPYFVKNNKRYIISLAEFNYTQKLFVIKRIIPEGKPERDFTPSDIDS